LASAAVSLNPVAQLALFNHFAGDAEMVGNHGQLRMPLRDAREVRHRRAVEHHRQTIFLRKWPEPIDAAVGQPGPLRRMKRQPDADHSRLFLPIR